ncbi:MAG: sulfite exporter TauE/SafE family protein [Gemmatimonadota bacterium]|nr:sulfite exporter TauE/SafE family protein [Gemmatimonadota bacterium]
MEVLGYFLAAIIGLSLGLLGGGGSILTVPIFVYVMGFGAKQAIAMSLPVVGATSLFGAASHWRSGNVRVRTAVFFGIVAMLGSYAGARVAVHVSGAVQLSLLAVVMLAAAISMFRSKRESLGVADADDRRTGQKLSVPLLAAVGLGVGLLTGLVGIGGGFLIVPALVVLARVPMKQAVGTSLLVIAMNSFSGFLGYVGRVEIPWGLMALFTFIAIAGILVGTHLVRFVSQWALKRAFAAFLVVMGALILYQNRSVL